MKLPPVTLTSAACSASSALSMVNVPPVTDSVPSALMPLQESASSASTVSCPPFAVMSNVPPEIFRSPSACTPSAAETSVSVPPEMVISPLETVSGSVSSSTSGEALTASPPALISSVPPRMVSASSHDRPSSTASMVSTSSSTVIEDCAAPLMPFL